MGSFTDIGQLHLTSLLVCPTKVLEKDHNTSQSVENNKYHNMKMRKAETTTKAGNEHRTRHMHVTSPLFASLVNDARTGRGPG
jgi:hypothetical protein